MSVAQKLPLFVQNSAGRRRGRTRVVDAEKVSFEIDLVIPEGIKCRFQLKLPDDEEMGTGILRIDRAQPKRGPSLPRYLAHTLEMSQLDRERLANWRSHGEVRCQRRSQGAE